MRLFLKIQVHNSELVHLWAVGKRNILNSYRLFFKDEEGKVRTKTFKVD
jgi:hypothetical protein